MTDDRQMTRPLCGARVMRIRGISGMTRTLIAVDDHGAALSLGPARCGGCHATMRLLLARSGGEMERLRRRARACYDDERQMLDARAAEWGSQPAAGATVAQMRELAASVARARAGRAAWWRVLLLLDSGACAGVYAGRHWRDGILAGRAEDVRIALRLLLRAPMVVS